MKRSWTCLTWLVSAVVSTSVSVARPTLATEVLNEDPTHDNFHLGGGADPKSPSAESATRKERKAGAIRLKSVSYSGPKYRAVRQDDNTANYDAPHWEDRSNPPDGDALDLDDRKFPVSYVRATVVKISATWIVDPPANFQNCLARGTGRDGMRVPQTSTTLIGNALSIPEVALNQPLPATIKFYNEFTIRWELSLNGGGAWIPAGTSGNRMYVTLSDPVAGAVPFESVLEIGTRNADAESDPAAAVAKVWNDFSNPIPGVKRKVRDGYNRPDEREMTYWKNPGEACLTMEEMLASQSGDGKCKAWARLFHQILQNLGVPGSKVIEVTTTYRNDQGHQDLPGVPASEHRGVMLIKRWTNTPTGTAQGACIPFTHQVDEVQDLPGISGQGNNDPPASFVEHFIVQIESSFYDPSYGMGPFGSQEAWEAETITHFGKVCVMVIGQDQGKVFKTNGSAIETVFAAVP